MVTSQILQSRDHLSICSRQDLLQRCKDGNNSETNSHTAYFAEYSTEHVGSNPTVGMDVCLLRVLCVVR